MGIENRTWREHNFRCWSKQDFALPASIGHQGEVWGVNQDGIIRVAVLHVIDVSIIQRKDMFG